MNKSFLSLLLILFILSIAAGFYISDSISHEPSLEEEKTVYLLAERNGEIMDWEEFRGETDEVYFFTDSKWRHEEGGIGGEFRPDLGIDVPALEVPKEDVTLNLLWEVPGFGEVVQRLDLSGFEDNETIDLLEELAVQRYETLLEEYERVEEEYKELEEYISTSEQKLEENAYMEALNHSLWGLEKITLRGAEEKIEEERKERKTVEVVDEDNETVENATVEYALEQHDFQFGWSSPRPDEELAEKMKDLGFNTYQQFSFLHQTQPQRGSWNFERQKERMEITKEFDQSVAGLISDPSPYWSNISDDELQGEVKKHVSKTIRELEGFSNVSRWECYGFGMHYMADQSLHITVNRSKETNINTTLTCVETAREEGDGDVVVTGWNIDGSEIWNGSYSDDPYTYYEKLDEDFDIGFDFMYFGGAHEMYPDLVEGDIYRQEAVGETRKNWIPARSLYSISEMLDWYSELDRDIHIQYFEAPSNYLEDHKGYWKEPWSEDIQAEWIESYYMLVYSKPYVESINYLEPVDSYWKDLETGILKEDRTPKDSYSSLDELINSWESEGIRKTSSEGLAEFEGHKGSYRINVSKNEKSFSGVIDVNSTTVILS